MTKIPIPTIPEQMETRTTKGDAMKRAVRLITLAVTTSFAWGLVMPVAFSQEKAPSPEGMPFSYGLGYEKFQNHCSECHGSDLTGTDKGPPLLHGYYKPSHHADAAFYRSISQGSPQHHWNFGDMSPVADVDENAARAIVEFVRWFQRESGLY